jgi:DNA-binding FadR family transcriptional regulator
MRSVDQVRDHLLREIAAGTFVAGQRLPAERDLCATLAVGRSAVRDALAVLENEGRVRRRPGSGTYVTNPTAATPPPPSPAQVMEARLLIEPGLAQLVAANGTLGDFAAMEDCLRRGAAARTMAEFEVEDGALHAAIVQAAHNPLIRQAYDLVTAARDQDDWGELKRRSLTPERRAMYQQDHARIVAALRRRDSQTGEAELRAHLVRVRANLLAP